MVKENDSLISFEEFLVSIAPGQNKTVNVFSIQNSYSPHYSVQVSKLELHCSEKSCNGTRFFEIINNPSAIIEDSKHLFLTFKCKNCDKSLKSYSIIFKLIKHNLCEVYKIGELPKFGPPIPSRMFKLLGEDKDLFMLGRRAENQGMGIGAFTYYRRVVENQKDRIFDEIIKVLQNIKGAEKFIADLKNAKKEQQFTNAIDSVKSALPDILLISSHNPLTLLHRALSKGIHSNSEEECLELATSIRIVLAELSDRITHILKEQKELNNAVSKLLNKKK